MLTLQSGDDERLVRFALRRWPAGMAIAPGGGPADGAGEPSYAMEQDYRNLGRQVVFFASGAFNKGSLQVAPNTVFGGEFGLIGPDRRHRLVQLYSKAGHFDQLELGAAELEGLMVQPDGGWLPAAGRMERLIRRNDASGAWHSASHEVLTRC